MKRDRMNGGYDDLRGNVCPLVDGATTGSMFTGSKMFGTYNATTVGGDRHYIAFSSDSSPNCSTATLGSPQGRMATEVQEMALTVQCNSLDGNRERFLLLTGVGTTTTAGSGGNSGWEYQFVPSLTDPQGVILGSGIPSIVNPLVVIEIKIVCPPTLLSPNHPSTFPVFAPVPVETRGIALCGAHCPLSRFPRSSQEGVTFAARCCSCSLNAFNLIVPNMSECYTPRPPAARGRYAATVDRGELADHADGASFHGVGGRVGDPDAFLGGRGIRTFGIADLVTATVDMSKMAYIASARAVMASAHVVARAAVVLLDAATDATGSVVDAVVPYVGRGWTTLNSAVGRDVRTRRPIKESYDDADAVVSTASVLRSYSAEIRAFAVWLASPASASDHGPSALAAAAAARRAPGPARGPRAAALSSALRDASHAYDMEAIRAPTGAGGAGTSAIRAAAEAGEVSAVVGGVLQGARGVVVMGDDASNEGVVHSHSTSGDTTGALGSTTVDASTGTWRVAESSEVQLEVEGRVDGGAVIDAAALAATVKESARQAPGTVAINGALIVDISGCLRSSDPIICCDTAFVDMLCSAGIEFSECLCGGVGAITCPTRQNYRCPESKKALLGLLGLIGILPLVAACIACCILLCLCRVKPTVKGDREPFGGAAAPVPVGSAMTAMTAMTAATMDSPMFI